VVLILGFVAALAYPSTSEAKTITITATEDEPRRNRPPVPGSLREALRLAEPGDTIVFNVPGPVVLRGGILTSEDQTGLTIQGPAMIQSAGKSATIGIRTDHLTLQNLRLQNIHVLVPERSVATMGVRLLNNTLVGNSRVKIENAQDCLVSGNTAEVRGHFSGVIQTTQTLNCQIVDNPISTPKPSRQIVDDDSTNLVIARNTLNGTIESEQQSGEISDNMLSGKGLISVDPPRVGASGFLRIAGNTAPHISVDRTNVAIVGNTVEPPGESELGGLDIENIEEDAQGEVLVERNTVRGGKNGILYSEQFGSVPGKLRENIVSGCSKVGIRVVAGLFSPLIQRNQIQNCGEGRGARGSGGLVILGGANPLGLSGVVAEENIIDNITGIGITVFGRTNARLIRNTIRRSTEHGIMVDTGVGRVIIENNIISANGQAGVFVEPRAEASVLGNEINGNGTAGVFIDVNALVSVSQVSMQNNQGPGIDIKPEGVTPNEEKKRGNLDLDWPIELQFIDGFLEGRAAPGSRVEVYRVEPPPRIGNPQNGEGINFLADTIADAAGHFRVGVPCEPGDLLTTTATLPGDQPATVDMAHTSEFSLDVTCTRPPPSVDLDNDGVPDDRDACLNTPPGQPVDANGCAEGQRDDDGDGANNANDQCPGTPSNVTANSDGCVQTVETPNGKVFSNSTAPLCNGTPESGCTCVLCYIKRIFDGVTAECPNADQVCTIDTAGNLGTTNGALRGPEAHLGCTDAMCVSAREGATTCNDGSAGGCMLTAEDGASLSCPPDISCDLISTKPGFPDAAVFSNSVLLVRKLTEDGDGEFRFDISAGGVNATSSLQTENEAGTKNLLIVTNTSPFRIVEGAPAGWTLEDVHCDPPTALESVDLANRTVDFSLPPEALITAVCTFTNRGPGVGVDTDMDGVPDTIDICTEGSQSGRMVNEFGCERSIPGPWGHVHCNNILTCQVEENGGACTDCGVVGDAGEKHDCFGETNPPTVCVVQADGTAGSNNCRFRSPGADVNGGSCEHKPGGLFTCGPDGCATTIKPSGLMSSCPPPMGCTTTIEHSVYAGTITPPDGTAAVIIEKQTIDGDGTFGFELGRMVGGKNLFRELLVTTRNRIGTEIAYLRVDAPVTQPLFVRESGLPPGWALESIECDAPHEITTPSMVRVNNLAPGDVVVCAFINRKLPPTSEVRPLSELTGIDAADQAGSFGLPPGNRISIGGSNGFIIIDALTDQIPTAGNALLSFTGLGESRAIGALVVKNPLGNDSDAIFAYGANGTTRQYFPDSQNFGFIAIGPFGTLTDGVHFGGDPAAPGVLWVNHSGNRVGAQVWRDFGTGELILSGSSVNTLGSGSNFPGASGAIISAFAFDTLKFGTNGLLAPDSTGWVAAVTIGQPGELWLKNPATFTNGIRIGSVGNDPRRIRCLPSAQLCVVSNFGSDSLTIVQWDGLGNAAILGTVSVGDGPVGIDLRTDGDNVAVLSTGFNDHTYTITELGPDGSVVSNVTQPAPDGCANPGHGLWLNDAANTAVITCSTSNAYAVITP
jgi:hypothetical protein